MDLHAIIKVSFHQIHKISSGYRGVITIKHNAKKTILKIWVVLHLDFHLNDCSSLQERHTLVFFWHFIGEAIHHVLFNTAEIQFPRKISAAVSKKGTYEKKA